MKQKNLFYSFMITAVCIALCIVLPLTLHAIPNAGILFSPMHIPVLLCGLICGWRYGLLCGAVAPLLSSLITSMPAMANLPFMMVELAVYGMIAGLIMKYLQIKHTIIKIYISLIIAMLCGRILAGILRALVFAGGTYSLSLWASSYFVSCLPGILVQLSLIPILYLTLKKAGLPPISSN